MKRILPFIIVIALLSITYCVSLTEQAEAATHYIGVGTQKDTDSIKGNIYTLLVGINSSNCQGCVNDADDLGAKLRGDFSNSKVSLRQNIKQFILTNNDATRSNIHYAIDNIARQAKPEDTFIFMFSGVSLNITKDTCILLLSGSPELKTIALGTTTFDSTSLPVPLLAEWLSALPCNNQVIISEAGQGSDFANSLMISLFERNSFISNGLNRSRTIITTTSFGIDYIGTADHINGTLIHYLLSFDNLLSSFHELKYGSDEFEYELLSRELAESKRSVLYSKVYSEADYSRLLSLLSPSSRGTMPDLPDPSSTGSHRKIGLFICTNQYHTKHWSNLKNPINDGNAVAEVLKSKYGFEIINLINAERDTILKQIAAMRVSLDSSDQVFVFIAGHGYYNPLTGCGHIIPSGGESTGNDQYTNSSYLHWNDLKGMFDSWPARNVCVVLDVCFGGKFDNVAPSTTIQDYSSMMNDLTPAQFAERKSKYYSRLFLASGSTSVPDYWNNSWNHSPFADKLIKLLQTENQFITPYKIYKELQMNITEPSLKCFGKHDMINGEFVLVPTI